MITLTKEKVLALHRRIADASGGSIGLRDEGLLESSLNSAFASFGGVDFYPTVEEKAARLGYSLISNHAFLDGNKRIGIFVMLVFLQVNGFTLSCSNDDVVHITLSVAAEESGYAELLTWIHTFCKQP